MIGYSYYISAHVMLLVEAAEYFLAVKSITALEDDSNGLWLAVVVDCVVNVLNRSSFVCDVDYDVVVTVDAVSPKVGLH